PVVEPQLAGRMVQAKKRKKLEAGRRERIGPATSPRSTGVELGPDTSYHPQGTGTASPKDNRLNRCAAMASQACKGELKPLPSRAAQLQTTGQVFPQLQTPVI